MGIEDKGGELDHTWRGGRVLTQKCGDGSLIYKE